MKRLGVILVSLCLLSACSSNPKDETQVQEDPKEKVVSFVGVGDNLIHETIYQDADKLAGEVGDGKYDFTPMYEDVKKDIQSADIAFINQETIVGGQELGLSGYPSFNSPTEVASNLETTGFNLVNLATNHSLDKGSSGIKNALNAFDTLKGVTYNGIASSLEEANSIPVFERDGIKFSFLAYTYGTNGINPANEYEVSYFDETKIKEEVPKAKAMSDVVIVSAHWGDENTFAPNDFQKQYAQLFADLEVDVVIGTHPHTIHPIEWVKGEGGNETLVVYSLGNFIGGMLEVQNSLSGMVSFDFVQDLETEKISIENVLWTPLFIHFEGNQSNILAERYNYKVYKLENYSDELAQKHVLNGYEGQSVSIDELLNQTRQVIAKEFLK